MNNIIATGDRDGNSPKNAMRGDFEGFYFEATNVHDETVRASSVALVSASGDVGRGSQACEGVSEERATASDERASAAGCDTRLDVYRQSHTQDSTQRGYLPGVENEKSSGKLRKIGTKNLADLRVCTDAWAVRHKFVNTVTGEMVPMLCDKYSCLYCGPRRVEVWRTLIEAAQAQRFITLSRVGKTLKEVGRVATTVAQNLRRRGFKFEYCMVFEKHKNGYFHIHMLQKGDYIPKAILSEALYTATHDNSYIVDIRACKAGSVGYITKYCTKALTETEIGRKENGTRARVNRVRYSKGFFPESTQKMRDVLKEQSKQKALEAGKDVETSYGGMWVLRETAPLPRDAMGRVDQVAAIEQHEQLVTELVNDAASDIDVNGGKMVTLAYMFDAYQEMQRRYNSSKSLVQEE